jgi:hypothetical protein
VLCLVCDSTSDIASASLSSTYTQRNYPGRVCPLLPRIQPVLGQSASMKLSARAVDNPRSHGMSSPTFAIRSGIHIEWPRMTGNEHLPGEALESWLHSRLRGTERMI